MQFEKAGKYILNKLCNDLPGHLYYHNVDHTKDVYTACEHLAIHENIDSYETQLLLTAACYHDSGFLTRTDDHETASCEIAGSALINCGYSVAEIEKICGIIMATRIPQSPKNHLEEILADADLDYLGRDDFFIISNKLYLELFALGKIQSMKQWDELQITFFENHNYFTKTACKRGNIKKEAHLKQLKANLNKEKL